MSTPELLLYETADLAATATLLEDAGIEWQEQEIHIPRHATGIAFPAENRELAFRTLGLSADSRLGGTNLRHVQLIHPTQYPVTMERTGGLEALARMKPVIEEFAQQVAMPVHVINFHHEYGYADRVTDQGIWLCFWASPAGRHAPDHTHSKVFGFDMAGGQQDGVEFSGTGLPIADDSGQVHAEVLGNVIYVLFDLPHYSSDATVGALRAILNAALPLMDSATDPERREAAALERRRNAKKDFIAACTAAQGAQAKNARARLADLEQAAESYSRSLVEAMRSMEEYRLLVENGAALTARQQTELSAIFDSIAQVPGITSVEMLGRAVRLTTEYLITDELSDGTRRHLGRYQITIPMNGEHISARNIDRTIHGRNHPHDVGGVGVLCLGNAQDGMSKLVAQFQIGILAEFLIAFLQRPNTEDTLGTRIFNWPIYTEGEEAT